MIAGRVPVCDSTPKLDINTLFSSTKTSLKSETKDLINAMQGDSKVTFSSLKVDGGGALAQIMY